jgi:NADH:ubiquinone oxidoreductase subunit K
MLKSLMTKQTISILISVEVVLNPFKNLTIVIKNTDGQKS